MTDTIGRIPLWLIGTVTGTHVIGLIGIFKAPFPGWVHLCNHHIN